MVEGKKKRTRSGSFLALVIELYESNQTRRSMFWPIPFTEASETGAGIDAREAARRSPEDVAVSNCLLNMAMPICCNAPESAIILLDIGVRFMTIPPS